MSTDASPFVVSYVIVSWNAKSYLSKCLRSLEIHGGRYRHEVVVVDNASSDGSPECVAADFPWVRLIQNRENFGFAKANNIGIATATGKYICLLNSDVELLPGCVDTLVDYCDKHPDVGMAGPSERE